MPLVLLEGPDGGGKTTLAQRLLKGTGHPTLLVKRSGPPGAVETLNAQAKWIADQADSGLNIIADRHPIISDSIYGPVVRKESTPFWEPAEVARTIHRTDTLIVYCRPHYARMDVSRRAEDQMEGVHQNYRALVNEYDRWFRIFEDSNVDFIRYNFESDPEGKEVVRQVKLFWEGKR